MPSAAATSTATAARVFHRLSRVQPTRAKKRIEAVKSATRNHIGVLISMFSASAFSTASHSAPFVGRKE